MGQPSRGVSLGEVFTGPRAFSELCVSLCGEESFLSGEFCFVLLTCRALYPPKIRSTFFHYKGVFFFLFKCALFSLALHDFGGNLVTALHTCSPPASIPDTPYMSWRWGGGGVGQGVAPLWQQQRQKSN